MRVMNWAVRRLSQYGSNVRHFLAERYWVSIRIPTPRGDTIYCLKSNVNPCLQIARSYILGKKDRYVAK